MPNRATSRIAFFAAVFCRGRVEAFYNVEGRAIELICEYELDSSNSDLDDLWPNCRGIDSAEYSAVLLRSEGNWSEKDWEDVGRQIEFTVVFAPSENTDFVRLQEVSVSLISDGKSFIGVIPLVDEQAE
ncbi:MAG: hypothetical protein KatS3mg109_0101 [Pirellulaceae bacterium]|nr:MAG: hypothetical protein KatS3mg109_0101 [Pirellulaceae bacterium]